MRRQRKREKEKKKLSDDSICRWGTQGSEQVRPAAGGRIHSTHHLCKLHSRYLHIMPFCDDCFAFYPTQKGVSLHVQRTPGCFQKWTERLAALSRQRFEQTQQPDDSMDIAPTEEVDGADNIQTEMEEGEYELHRKSLQLTQRSSRLQIRYHHRSSSWRRGSNG